MYVIGLTGGIGSGKTTVSDLFAQLGICVVDCDVISRQITSTGGVAIEKIKEAFGTEAITPDGAMDRKYVRDLVFKDPSKKELLQSILHPIIRKECALLLSKSTSRYTILSVPLLYPNSYWYNTSNRILVVDVPEDVQIERVMKRSHLSATEVSSIIRSQMPRLDRLAMADDVILNTRDMAILAKYVKLLDRKYSSLSIEDRQNPVKHGT